MMERKTLRPVRSAAPAWSIFLRYRQPLTCQNCCDSNVGSVGAL